MKKLHFLFLSIFLFFACGKKIPQIPDVKVTPKIKISTTNFTEGIDEFVVVNLSLENEIDSLVFVNYKTVSISAEEGKDFEATSGILVFSKDDASHKQSIFIDLLDDDKYEEEENFEIQFTTDSLVNLEKDKITITILDNDEQITDNDFPGYLTPKSYDGWKLLWADEFGGETLDLDKWNVIVGNGCPSLCGFGNNEFQYYRAENIELVNGLLTIHALKEDFQDRHYTSARILTQDKFFYTFGRMDIRAKLPYSQGLWPALWMMGQNKKTVGWPECGETDVMELRGAIPNTTSSTLHYKNASGKHQNTAVKKHVLEEGNYSDEFHVFTTIWNEHKIEFFVDDIRYHTVFFSSMNFYNNTNSFLKDFFILMNVAVGGNFGGNPDSSTQWPQKMEVDYVRVFQKE